MIMKLSIAAAAIVLCGGPALAQPATSGDVRQDRAEMQSDAGQVHADTAVANRLGSQIKMLRSRARHETGAKKAADLAEANRLDHEYMAEHHKGQAAYGAYAKTQSDVRQDMSKAPDRDETKRPQ